MPRIDVEYSTALQVTRRFEDLTSADRDRIASRYLRKPARVTRWEEVKGILRNGRVQMVRVWFVPLD